MPILKNAFRGHRQVGIGVLLFITLLGGLPRVSLADCAFYQSSVNQAMQAKNLDTLEELLVTLNMQPDCRVAYLEWIKRRMAQIAATRADRLVQQGELVVAETWLKRAPTIVWVTQVIHGDIAARRRQWQTASSFYNQALDLITDTEVTPQAPTQAVIEKVYQLASEAQVLANNLEVTVSRSGETSGMMRSSMRGFIPVTRIVPIRFKYGKMALSRQGKKSARRLARYLKRRNWASVTLIGHTDSKGSHAVNDRISKKRAKAVKKQLRKLGVRTKIRVTGKGKRKPLRLANHAIYTQAEIDALNRRVEFVTK
jgi:outer membrane protein OmpA-like peptidoglycan-associated protein